MTKFLAQVIEEDKVLIPQGATHYSGILTECPEFYRVDATRFHRWVRFANKWEYCNLGEQLVLPLQRIEFIDTSIDPADIPNNPVKVMRHIRHVIDTYLPEGATHYIGHWHKEVIILRKVQVYHRYKMDLYFIWCVITQKWKEWEGTPTQMEQIKEIILANKEEGERHGKQQT